MFINCNLEYNELKFIDFSMVLPSVYLFTVGKTFYELLNKCVLVFSFHSNSDMRAPSKDQRKKAN